MAIPPLSFANILCSVNFRSSDNASDIGKMTNTPVLRVNADHPEVSCTPSHQLLSACFNFHLQEVVKACKLALAYRQKFRKDIVVDYVCFRRWGHNEVDDPSFTNPLMYNVIRSRMSIPDLYAKKLIVCLSLLYLCNL
jgi:probable 2-oxoglutarate dehydrogenase E1 component DHKTD1